MTSKSSSGSLTSKRSVQQPVGRGRGNTSSKPKKIKPDKNYEADFAPNPSLKEAFTVLIAGTLGITQYTVHHPIGSSDLSDDEWIITPTGDIHYLLERAEDPDKKEKTAQAMHKRVSLAIEAKILDLKDNTVLYASSGSIRNDVLAKARKARTSGQGSLLEFIEDERDQESESKLEKLWSSDETHHEINKIMGGYLTLGGPLADQVQRPNTALKGLSSAGARDHLTRMIYGFSGINYQVVTNTTDTGGKVSLTTTTSYSNSSGNSVSTTGSTRNSSKSAGSVQPAES